MIEGENEAGRCLSYDIYTAILAGLPDANFEPASDIIENIRLIKSDDGDWVPGPFVFDNDKNWSGDHVSVDPDLVKGLFLCNREVTVPEGGFDLRHIAPTALAILGVRVPPEYDLAPLQVGE